MHVHVYIVYKFKLYLLVCHLLMAVEMSRWMSSSSDGGMLSD